MQHINLVSQLDRYVEPTLSARQQQRLLAAVVVLMLLIYGAMLVVSSGLDDQLKQARSQQQLATAELTKRQAEKQRLQQDPELDNDIASLERGVAFRRQMLASIDPEQAGGGQNFAEHLAGLARQHIDGLWFTRIQLQNNGQQLVLQGKTKQPEYVPQLLQNLAAEPVFAGQQFKVLRMSVPEQWQGALDFEVRSRALEASP